MKATVNACLFLLAMALAVGCGPSGPVTSQVAGSVTLDGQPLDDAVIEFQPTDGARGMSLDIVGGQFSGEVPIGPKTVRFAAMRAAKPDPRLSAHEVQNPLQNILPERYGFDSTLRLELTETPATDLKYELTSR